MNIYIRQDIPVGIYWNQTDWLITASDWDNMITIADKNLWATSTDTSSTDSYWNVYQRWNNYWVPGSRGTSSWTVNASTYWPNNYYSSSIFRSSSYGSEAYEWYWDSSYNADLWWWTTDTYEARKWPCDTWWHIPSESDIASLNTILTSLSVSWWLKSLFKMPTPWWNDKNGDRTADTMSVFWTSNSTGNNTWGRFYEYGGANFQYYGNFWKSIALSIRPFKNEPVTPTSSRTVLYQPS